MPGHRQETCVSTRTDAVRTLNDALRTRGVGGQLMLTSGVRALDEVTIGALIHAMRLQAEFGPDSDPYGEHDMGTVTVGGHRAFWKIDYYDRTLTRHSPDPGDASVTRRVLTLMLASEY